jgi:hypothetical protein
MLVVLEDQVIKLDEISLSKGSRDICSSIGQEQTTDIGRNAGSSPIQHFHSRNAQVVN